MKSDAPPDIKIDEPSDVMEQHPNMRRGEKPLFDGERNPQTGEVGGPKTNPLKYGDYSYNGRVTGMSIFDFSVISLFLVHLDSIQ